MDNSVIDNLNCFIDLHLHLDGSLPFETVKHLFEMNKMSTNFTDDELKSLLSVERTCKSREEYVEKFDLPLSLLQTQKSIETAVFELKEKLKSDGVIYAEIRFAPQRHTRKGLSIDQVIRAALRGQAKSDLKSNLIVALVRGDNNDEYNYETIIEAKKYLGHGICAFDLEGNEAKYPIENYEKFFKPLGNELTPFTIHAGETTGPKNVETAISFGARRIGHGIRAIESNSTMKLIKDKNIALELCPTSNLNTGVVEELKDYQFKGLINFGLRLTINTNNMTVSNTNIKHEYKILNNEFNLNEILLKNLLMNSVRASFASPNIRVYLENEINKQFAKLKK